MAGTNDPPPNCVRCGEPVVVNRDQYDVFERMHWVCFHFEFEHMSKDHKTADPDSACIDASCPWNRLQKFEAKLRELGVDPDSTWLPFGADG